MSNNLVAHFILKGIREQLIKYALFCGTSLAITISWSLHNSIGWAIVHGILGWVYVFYAQQDWMLFSLSIAILLYGAYKAYFAVLSLNNIMGSLEKGFK
jgi:hypothetical protein